MKRALYGIACLTLLAGGCARHSSPGSPTAVTRPPRPAAHKVVSTAAPTAKPAAPTGAEATANVPGPAADIVARFKAVQASVKPYTVSPSLKEVSNYPAIGKTLHLTPVQQQLLAKNLFVCSPTDIPQLFHIYENNDYLNLPSFVSTDLVLQLYHIFYDFSLRTVEEKELDPALHRLTQGMLTRTLATWKAATDPTLKQAALKNAAFFGVAAAALGLKAPIPQEAQRLVDAEMALIDGHKGFAVGSIFPYKIDYSQFVPRGHYTRTPVLKRFFRTMMWYGLTPFAVDYDDGSGKKVRSDESIRQGLLWVRDLHQAGLEGDWEKIYEPTRFYVGASDDLTPGEWSTLSEKIYGADAAPSAFADPGKLDAFAAAAEKLRPAAIQFQFGRAAGAPAGTIGMIEPPVPVGNQLRFMGQRDIPDSEILQHLTTPIERPFPSGLDVMAVLGSQRAAAILDQYPAVYNAGHWAGYRAEREKLAAQTPGIPAATWSSNLYWSWLDVLRTLLQPAPEGFPSFMRSEAWQDKSINTSLASWSELRHDTILYGKQSGAECGGGDEPPVVHGYVEPNIVFYDRLLKLTQQSRTGLDERKLLPPELKDRFDQFEDLLTLLKTISQKELNGQKLTEEEYNEIRYIGGKFENLTLSVMEGNANSWDLVNETDKDMATVADVHTGGSEALEEGVGHADEILVIVPVEGKLVLTRGAVFSHYEFKHPVSDRLTDEKWQQQIKSGSLPELPVWTRSFLAPGRPPTAASKELAHYSTGC